MAPRFGLSVVVVLASCIVGCSPKQQAEPPLTAEGKGYIRSLPLTDVGMKATESYAKQVLTEIEGNIKNTGDRTVNRVDVFCLFYDRYGHLVLRERASVVKNTLKPGESRRFRLAFDDVPESWNNQMPALVIAQVIFA